MPFTPSLRPDENELVVTVWTTRLLVMCSIRYGSYGAELPAVSRRIAYRYLPQHMVTYFMIVLQSLPAEEREIDPAVASERSSVSSCRSAPRLMLLIEPIFYSGRAYVSVSTECDDIPSDAAALTGVLPQPSLMLQLAQEVPSQSKSLAMTAHLFAGKVAEAEVSGPRLALRDSRCLSLHGADPRVRKAEQNGQGEATIPGCCRHPRGQSCLHHARGAYVAWDQLEGSTSPRYSRGGHSWAKGRLLSILRDEIVGGSCGASRASPTLSSPVREKTSLWALPTVSGWPIWRRRKKSCDLRLRLVHFPLFSKPIPKYLPALPILPRAHVIKA